MSTEIGRIQRHQGCQISAGGMPGNEHPLGISTVRLNIVESPDEGRCRVFDMGGGA